MNDTETGQEAALKDCEDDTGIGIDRAKVTAIRAHCIEAWDDVLTIEPRNDDDWTFDMSGCSAIILDEKRVRLLSAALQEALR